MKMAAVQPASTSLRRVMVVSVWLVACASLGCGAGLGQNAAAGAMGELRQQREQREAQGLPPPSEEVAGSMVKGALSEFDDPERRAELSRVVGAATESALESALGATGNQGAWGGGPAVPDGTLVGSLGDQFSTGFAQGMSRQLRLELGPTGDGPLGQSLSSLVQQLSGAAANGVVGELAPVDPECSGPLRKQCTEQRVYDLSKTAAVGFADGIAHSLRVGFLIAAFVAGLIVAFGLSLLMRRRPRSADPA